uniref:Uncharacterized protein n=1 Tax=Panagrolaimus superbus TaxID=310955 RepID=A0A914YRL9_9BILA
MKPLNVANCECQPFVQNNQNFVPFKVWAENKSIYVLPLAYLYVFEEEIQKMITQNCHNEKFVGNCYGHSSFHSIGGGFGYLHSLTVSENNEAEMNQTFFNENGADYINLINPITVVWLNIKDSAPEHFLLIESENGEMIQNSFE